MLIIGGNYPFTIVHSVCMNLKFQVFGEFLFWSYESGTQIR
jgi:hypothetical protein